MSPAGTGPPFVTDSLLVALRAAGIKTGDAEPKDENLDDLKGQFCVIYPIAEHAPDGPTSDPSQDRTIDVQITSVAPTRKACDFQAAAARKVALGPLVPPRGYLWLAPVGYVVGNPTQRENPDDPEHPGQSGYYKTDLYRFTITPHA
ncbi:hypothetical protein ACPCTH_33515 [Streptomyces cellulosae]